MTELTLEQVERLGEHLRHENLSGVVDQILAHDAAQRTRITELEQALRLHLAVSPDDPVLIEPVEQEVVRLRTKLEGVERERDEWIRRAHHEAKLNAQTGLENIELKETNEKAVDVNERTIYQ